MREGDDAATRVPLSGRPSPCSNAPSRRRPDISPHVGSGQDFGLAGYFEHARRNGGWVLKQHNTSALGAGAAALPPPDPPRPPASFPKRPLRRVPDDRPLLSRGEPPSAALSSAMRGGATASDGGCGARPASGSMCGEGGGERKGVCVCVRVAVCRACARESLWGGGTREELDGVFCFSAPFPSAQPDSPRSAKEKNKFTRPATANTRTCVCDFHVSFISLPPP